MADMLISLQMSARKAEIISQMKEKKHINHLVFAPTSHPPPPPPPKKKKELRTLLLHFNGVTNVQLHWWLSPKYEK